MLKELWTGQITIEWQSRGGLHAHIPLVGMKMEKCCIRSWICNSKRVEVSYTREGTQIVETAGGCSVLGVLPEHLPGKDRCLEAFSRAGNGL